MDVYSPAGWRGQKAPSWLASSIAAGWCCRWPWSATLVRAVESAECSSQRKLLHQLLSGSQVGYCFPVALDHLFHSHGTSLEKTKRHLLKRKRKKTVLGKLDVENRQTHKQAVHEGFWFSFLLIHYSLQAVPQKVFLETDAAEKRRRKGKKNTKAFPFSAI